MQLNGHSLSQNIPCYNYSMKVCLLLMYGPCVQELTVRGMFRLEFGNATFAIIIRYFIQSSLVKGTFDPKALGALYYFKVVPKIVPAYVVG
jgi:hypothetical protein